MSLELARKFLEKLKSDEILHTQLVKAKSKEERRKIIAKSGFHFTHEEFIKAKSELSEWDLTMIEDKESFRSDKRKAGMEMCCCCSVGGNVK